MVECDVYGCHNEATKELVEKIDDEDMGDSYDMVFHVCKKHLEESL